MKKILLSFVLLAVVVSCKKDERSAVLVDGHKKLVMSYQVVSGPMTTASFTIAEHDFGNLW